MFATATPATTAAEKTTEKEKQQPQQEPAFANVQVTPYFSGIHEQLLRCISESSYVIGCMAWITDRDTLQLMAQKLRGASFVVQTESYLTRNSKLDRWRENLKKMYEKLPPFPWNEWQKHHPNMPLPAEMLHPSRQRYAIRIAGEKRPANGRRFVSKVPDQKVHPCEDEIEEEERKKHMMHHKFLLFFDERMMPTIVWTGSYNLSFRARDSWENVTVLRDPTLALNMEFFEEFLRVYEKSKPYRTTT